LRPTGAKTGREGNRRFGDTFPSKLPILARIVTNTQIDAYTNRPHTPFIATGRIFALHLTRPEKWSGQQAESTTEGR